MQSIPIIRKQQTTDQTSPWDGIVFAHEVGSDELAESLKTALPQYRTLRERKHAATIKFLAYELREMQSSSATPASAKTPPIHDLLSVSPITSKFELGANPTVHSQDLASLSHSPASSIDSAAHRDLKQRYAITSIPSSQPLFVNPMTAKSSSQLIFNAIDGRTMQQKSKRKMTAEERLEYRETRRRGACLKCKRQKGKCTHMNNTDNEPDVSSTSTKQPKRKPSLGTDAHDPKPSKNPRLEHTTDEYGCGPVSSHQHDVPQKRSSHLILRSSNESDRDLTAPSGVQWPNPVDKGAQLDTSGYVQQSSSFEQARSSLTINQTLYCQPVYDKSDMNFMNSVDYFQPRSVLITSQNRITTLRAPLICVHALDQELWVSSFPSFSQWSYNQPAYSNHTGMN